MRILIIEDEIIIARFIETEVRARYGAETAIALSSAEVSTLIPHFRPHLILCDIELNDVQDGIALMHRLKEIHLFELVFITSYQSMAIMNRAFELKPANYIIKPLDEARLYAGIHPIITQLNEQLSNEAEHPSNLIEQLTPVERTVLKRIAQQQTTKEIAEALHLSPHTVKNYRHRICRKLNLEEENNALLSWSLKYFRD